MANGYSMLVSICAANNVVATICLDPLQVVTKTTTQSGLMTLTFDLLTVEVVRNVNSGTYNLCVNFGPSATFLCVL